MKALDSSNNYYKAIYSANEYIEFKYNKPYGTTTLISYTVEGKNILDILKAVGTTPEKTQPNLYLNYVKIKKQSPFSNLVSFIFNPVNTIVSLVSNLGTFSANVGSSSNLFPISNYTQTSSSTCYDMTDLNSDDTKSLDNFLRSYYNLNGFVLKLSQSKMNGVGRHFRALYSNSRNKQI